MTKSKKKIFIAATRQNDGKTMTSLGLFNAIKKRFPKCGYMKPVGQQYLVIDDKKVDKDAVLFQKCYQLEDSFDVMSPIAVASTFTTTYLDNPKLDFYQEKLLTSFKKLKRKNDFLLIEGTGHAGVGSIFDLSNADVAKLFGSKVILVSLGGIGRSIDEILLNKAVFDLLGVEILGVIINKVRFDKYDKVYEYVSKALRRNQLKLLGCIPYVDFLNNPTVEDVFQKLDGKLLSHKLGFQNRIEKCVIGDTVPNEVLSSLTPNSLFIVPAAREGLIMAALCGNLLDSEVVYFVSGIILTGGKYPHERVLSLIKRAHIPLLLVEEDSFTITTKINNMLIKIGSNDSEKIEKIQDLCEEYVDVDFICENA
ncbi:hypothetical protein DID76_04425 [Candidatus Marinamargulisbacteria bacterium SCGC AG-414-C22]|nr:hypothetical protein DID76_04425 [Candidatus Marinamargulisbacteria bacterium SCGC AG-414-C22]